MANRNHQTRHRRGSGIRHAPQESGIALIGVLTVLTLVGLSLFLGQFNAASYQARRIQTTSKALAEAKDALIGDAVSRMPIHENGYLRLPDIGQAEGIAALNFTGNNKNLSVLGKYPWKTLRSEVLRDGHSECLWYVVSGRYKMTPATDALNWDTLGQIDVIDDHGNAIATGLAALLVAPGTPIAEQDRTLADPGYIQCGGNYDSRNYLDTYNIANAVAGEVNYFTGSTHGRIAATEDNKRFVMASSEHYNDHFLKVTVDDIFRPLIRRKDFSTAIDDLLGNPAFKSMVISGPKGTDNLACGTDMFCRNWKEMLFLTELPVPAEITIDGASSPVCTRILIFAGKRTAGQNRNTPVEKSSANNYLEGPNLASFNTPTAAALDFSGASKFDWHSPETDLIRCLQ